MCFRIQLSHISKTGQSDFSLWPKISTHWGSDWNGLRATGRNTMPETPPKQTLLLSPCLNWDASASSKDGAEMPPGGKGQVRVSFFPGVEVMWGPLEWGPRSAKCQQGATGTLTHTAGGSGHETILWKAGSNYYGWTCARQFHLHTHPDGARVHQRPCARMCPALALTARTGKHPNAHQQNW